MGCIPLHTRSLTSAWTEELLIITGAPAAECSFDGGHTVEPVCWEGQYCAADGAGGFYCTACPESTCPGGTYLAGCDKYGTSPGTCNTCSSCPLGQTRRECSNSDEGYCFGYIAETTPCASDIITECHKEEWCNAGGDPVGCQQCELCTEPNTYRAGCSGTSPGVCMPCGACPDNQIRVGCERVYPGSCEALFIYLPSEDGEPCMTHGCAEGFYCDTAPGQGVCQSCDTCPPGQYKDGCGGLEAGTCVECAGESSCLAGYRFEGCYAQSPGECIPETRQFDIGASASECPCLQPDEWCYGTTCMKCNSTSLCGPDAWLHECGVNDEKGQCKMCESHLCSHRPSGLRGYLDDCGGDSPGICRDCNSYERCGTDAYLAGCGLMSAGECYPCGTCAGGKVLVGCGSDIFASAGECYPCGFQCPAGTYVEGCGGRDMGECKPCNGTCPDGHFRDTESCGGLTPGLCVPCADGICLDGETMLHNGGGCACSGCHASAGCAEGEYPLTCSQTTAGACTACDPCPEHQARYWCKNTPGTCVDCATLETLVCPDRPNIVLSGCGGGNVGACTCSEPCPVGQFHDNPETCDCAPCNKDCTADEYAYECNRYTAGGDCRSCPDTAAWLCSSGEYLSGCGGVSQGSCVPCPVCPDGSDPVGCAGTNTGTCPSCETCLDGEPKCTVPCEETPDPLEPLCDPWVSGPSCNYECKHTAEYSAYKPYVGNDGWFGLSGGADQTYCLGATEPIGARRELCARTGRCAEHIDEYFFESLEIGIWSYPSGGGALHPDKVVAAIKLRLSGDRADQMETIHVTRTSAGETSSDTLCNTIPTDLGYTVYDSALTVECIKPRRGNYVQIKRESASTLLVAQLKSIEIFMACPWTMHAESYASDCTLRCPAPNEFIDRNRNACAPCPQNSTATNGFCYCDTGFKGHIFTAADQCTQFFVVDTSFGADLWDKAAADLDKYWIPAEAKHEVTMNMNAFVPNVHFQLDAVQLCSFGWCLDSISDPYIHDVMTNLAKLHDGILEAQAFEIAGFVNIKLTAKFAISMIRIAIDSVSTYSQISYYSVYVTDEPTYSTHPDSKYRCAHLAYWEPAPFLFMQCENAPLEGQFLSIIRSATAPIGSIFISELEAWTACPPPLVAQIHIADNTVSTPYYGSRCVDASMTTSLYNARMTTSSSSTPAPTTSLSTLSSSSTPSTSNPSTTSPTLTNTSYSPSTTLTDSYNGMESSSSVGSESSSLTTSSIRDSTTVSDTSTSSKTSTSEPNNIIATTAAATISDITIKMIVQYGENTTNTSKSNNITALAQQIAYSLGIDVADVTIEVVEATGDNSDARTIEYTVTIAQQHSGNSSTTANATELLTKNKTMALLTKAIQDNKLPELGTDASIGTLAPQAHTTEAYLPPITPLPAQTAATTTTPAPRDYDIFFDGAGARKHSTLSLMLTLSVVSVFSSLYNVFSYFCC